MLNAGLRCSQHRSPNRAAMIPTRLMFIVLNIELSRWLFWASIERSIGAISSDSPEQCSVRKKIMARPNLEEMTPNSRKTLDAGSNSCDSLGSAAKTATDIATDDSGKDHLGDKVGGVLAIKDHMDVIASCGKKIGVVDCVEGNAIKLTRKDSPDNLHHYIPLSWIERIDDKVLLNTNSKQTTEGWQLSSGSIIPFDSIPRFD